MNSRNRLRAKASGLFQRSIRNEERAAPVYDEPTQDDMARNACFCPRAVMKSLQTTYEGGVDAIARETNASLYLGDAKLHPYRRNDDRRIQRCHRDHSEGCLLPSGPHRRTSTTATPIILNSSVHAFMGWPCYSEYVATDMVRALTRLTVSVFVQVNQVTPGAIKTPFG